MKTAVVTGATGFIGKQLSIFLLNNGFEVYGIGRNEDKFKDLSIYPNFHKIILDFHDYNIISSLLEKEEIDLFFHAAYQGVNGVNKKNFFVQVNNLDIACTTVFQAIKLGCKRYIYIGSVDEYEISCSPDYPFKEPSPSRIYAAIKYSSEIIGKSIAFENKMEYVSALLVLTYGEGNETDVLPHMIIKNSINNKKIRLINGNNYFDMIHISEAIEGIWAVANKGKPYESYFIGHRELTTFRTIVKKISNIINNKVTLDFGAYPDYPNQIDYEKIDRDKLYRDTGCSLNDNMVENILITRKWIESHMMKNKN